MFQDPFDVGVQKQDSELSGTFEQPILVPTTSGERLVGCVCKYCQPSKLCISTLGTNFSGDIRSDSKILGIKKRYLIERKVSSLTILLVKQSELLILALVKGFYQRTY